MSKRALRVSSLQQEIKSVKKTDVQSKETKHNKVSTSQTEHGKHVHADSKDTRETDEECAADIFPWLMTLEDCENSSDSQKLLETFIAGQNKYLSTSNVATKDNRLRRLSVELLSIEPKLQDCDGTSHRRNSYCVGDKMAGNNLPPRTYFARKTNSVKKKCELKKAKTPVPKKAKKCHSKTKKNAPYQRQEAPINSDRSSVSWKSTCSSHSTISTTSSGSVVDSSQLETSSSIHSSSTEHSNPSGESTLSSSTKISSPSRSTNAPIIVSTLAEEETSSTSCVTSESMITSRTTNSVSSMSIFETIDDSRCHKDGEQQLSGCLSSENLWSNVENYSLHKFGQNDAKCDQGKSNEIGQSSVASCEDNFCASSISSKSSKQARRTNFKTRNDHSSKIGSSAHSKQTVFSSLRRQKIKYERKSLNPQQSENLVLQISKVNLDDRSKFAEKGHEKRYNRRGYSYNSNSDDSDEQFSGDDAREAEAKLNSVCSENVAQPEQSLPPITDAPKPHNSSDIVSECADDVKRCLMVKGLKNNMETNEKNEDVSSVHSADSHSLQYELRDDLQSPLTFEHDDQSPFQLSGFSKLCSAQEYVWQKDKLQTILEERVNEAITTNQLNLSKLELPFYPTVVICAALSNLKRLTLSDNSLVSLPTPSLSLLPSLTWLDLRCNFLTQLPDEELPYLDRLEVLLLQSNKLTRLPLELGTLASLKTLQVEDNPLQFPHSSILKQGTKAIKDFLQNREEIRRNCSSGACWSHLSGVCDVHHKAERYADQESSSDSLDESESAVYDPGKELGKSCGNTLIGQDSKSLKLHFFPEECQQELLQHSPHLGINISGSDSGRETLVSLGTPTTPNSPCLLTPNSDFPSNPVLINQSHVLQHPTFQNASLCDKMCANYLPNELNKSQCLTLSRNKIRNQVKLHPIVQRQDNQSKIHFCNRTYGKKKQTGESHSLYLQENRKRDNCSYVDFCVTNFSKMGYVTEEYSLTFHNEHSKRLNRNSKYPYHLHQTTKSNEVNQKLSYQRNKCRFMLPEQEPAEGNLASEASSEDVSCCMHGRFAFDGFACERREIEELQHRKVSLHVLMNEEKLPPKFGNAAEGQHSDDDSEGLEGDIGEGFRKPNDTNDEHKDSEEKGKRLNKSISKKNNTCALEPVLVNLDLPAPLRAQDTCCNTEQTRKTSLQCPRVSVNSRRLSLGNDRVITKETVLRATKHAKMKKKEIAEANFERKISEDLRMQQQVKQWREETAALQSTRNEAFDPDEFVPPALHLPLAIDEDALTPRSRFKALLHIPDETKRRERRSLESITCEVQQCWDALQQQRESSETTGRRLPPADTSSEIRPQPRSGRRLDATQSSASHTVRNNSLTECGNANTFPSQFPPTHARSTGIRRVTYPASNRSRGRMEASPAAAQDPTAAHPEVIYKRLETLRRQLRKLSTASDSA